MWTLHLGLISGVMVGLELKYLEEDYDVFLAIDLFIIRLVLQKIKHVR
jgi:hypothetical protein